ncbi:MAG: hypothetical protein EOO97_00400 [Pedobacter sp.]|nr:MAG: hypothetical protein EOO97_00400 [Pedobacter sp.]
MSYLKVTADLDLGIITLAVSVAALVIVVGPFNLPAKSWACTPVKDAQASNNAIISDLYITFSF